MDAKHGYSIMKLPTALIEEYENGKLARDHQEYLRELREAFSALPIRCYRGISRDPLQALPSLNDHTVNLFRNAGLDMDSNYAAARRFREMIGEDGCGKDDPYSSDLVPTLDQARELHALLDHPATYEIVRLSRGRLEVGDVLGFDIGWWGGDHFSLICDVAVAPSWHPADPTDLSDLFTRLKELNANCLFPTADAALAFRHYYVQRPWAEKEPGKFEPIMVALP